MANDQVFRYVANGTARDLASGLVRLHAQLCFAGGGLTMDDFVESAKLRADLMRTKYGASEDQATSFLAKLVGELAVFTSIAPAGSCTVKVSA